MESYATAQQVFAAGLVFARIGAVIMLLPGLGETLVPPRIRLSFALAFTLMIFPLIGGTVPPIPSGAADLGLAVIKEVLIGLLIGSILRLFMVSLSAAGEIVSMATTLSFSQTANPMQAQPSTSLGTFLGMIGIVLIFATNLDHLFIAAIVNSFELFPFTRDIPVADAGQLAVQTVSRSFGLGLQLAAPVVVFSLILNVATGLVGRVMPQFQVFFVATPLMVLGGLSIFALSLGVIGMVWIDRFRELAGTFAGQ
ncbi:MAG: flagellar type III secretion system protein FliR [Phenylobacterium sp.]|uniref:flagellar biosynthetic protein FliR n=1 Tax=unclassified Phenylobacterium TaxID=2640670 RepID=UPI0008BF7840|nr:MULTISPECIES: flagellar biosynthetic protein FliR [unclassified Phenylobacterium]MBJ7410440.1 flagellar type III secretion system protein FliR [Phenylobacterium sp.]OHB28698.1 MAG: flagellar biosynthetic protein FliR [Phenylobacterium sp. RIFCSPHIGHO2_01_FULL_69_31]